METPTQSATASGEGALAFNVVNGSVTIGSERRNLTLTLYAARTALAAADDAQVGWLSAYRSDVVPLLGRQPDIDALQAWLDAEPTISVRVLVGGAGRGKTRLAAEFARAVSKDWDAGFVGAADFQNFWDARRTERWRWRKPTLVILDYAAARGAALKDWLDELANLDLAGLKKLRLLLLERQAQPEIGWLGDLIAGDTDDARARAALLRPRDAVTLAPLDDLALRRTLFATLLARAKPGKEIGADGEFDRKLKAAPWGGDPLFAMMAGLVAAKSGVAEALSLSPGDLALAVADGELRRIGRLGAARGIDPPKGGFLRRIAALATLVQGGDAAAMRALAEAERTATKSAADLGAVVLALREALPSREPGKDIGPILPDIVGEAALLIEFGERSEGARAGVPPLPRLLAAARTAVSAASETLVRAAQDFAPAGRLEPIRWLDAFGDAPETDLGALMQIADKLPDQSLALRETAARLTEKICSGLMEARKTSAGAEVDPLMGAWLNNLGNRLRDLGRREDALKAAQEAVDIYRTLADERADLAMSLNNLGNCLSDLGRREDALKAAQEAVDNYRTLAAEKPDAFRPVLALSLNNLGNCLSELGRPEDALKAAQEAVDIRRTLAAERPDAFRPVLALSLSNLGNRLSDLGRREDALKAAQEAVDIRRTLAAERPDAFRPVLASSLSNLGNRLGDLGRREDALKAAQEAVDIYRTLAAERPDAFWPDLAMSLNNLGNCLSELGRREDALKAAQEAVDIRRTLAAERPDAFRPDLAMSLNNLGTFLSELGRREDALKAAQEAVDIYRTLAAERPDAFRPVLAMSLNNLGTFLSELGRREDALKAAQEAVDIYRTLAAERPDAFRPVLAMSLNNLGNRLSELGRREDALEAAQEAVDIRRTLAAERPDAFRPDLASSLNNLGTFLSELGRREDALKAAQEAVDIRRTLAAERSDAFRPDLAGSLGVLGNCLEESGRIEAAHAAVREAVETLAPYFLRTPPAHARWMAAMCRQYLERCGALGQAPDAALLDPIAAAFAALETPPAETDP